ncbi:MAG: hypothetical protein ABIL06_24860, partial [Pseudomonadota bacterium]
MKAVRFLVLAVLGVALAGWVLESPSFGSGMESKPAGSVSVGELIAYAYENNPSILEAREAWKAVVEDYRLTT